MPRCNGKNRRLVADGSCSPANSSFRTYLSRALLVSFGSETPSFTNSLILSKILLSNCWGIAENYLVCHLQIAWQLNILFFKIFIFQTYKQLSKNGNFILINKFEKWFLTDIPNEELICMSLELYNCLYSDAYMMM